MRKNALSRIDVQHDRKESGSYVVESFIARDDDSVFIPGAWVEEADRDPITRLSIEQMPAVY
jgi:hypothetical protein